MWLFLRRCCSIILLSLFIMLAGCGSMSQSQRQAIATVVGSPSPKATPTPTMTSTVTPTPQPTPTRTPGIGHPERLLIPRIGVNAPVEDVGITPEGTLATPTKNPWDGTGWYARGIIPGEKGSAVIAGHVDRPGGAPAIFWNLRDLQMGDDVEVSEDGGKTWHFRVLRVVTYPPQLAPVQDIFMNDSGKFLNLITCAGVWVPSEHQTTLRLVVYTQLVE